MDCRNYVHDNLALANSQKLGYVKSFISECPRNQIFGLLWNERDYYTALKELKKRYGNPSLIVEAYIDRVRAWPRLQDSSGVSGFCT